ncbi:hypothetical protein STEG23_013811 [Scotinomys teguina]
MQPDRATNNGGRTMEVKAAAPRCQLLLILLMSAVMLLPGTNGSLLLVQRTVTRTIVLQETISKAFGYNPPNRLHDSILGQVQPLDNSETIVICGINPNIPTFSMVHHTDCSALTWTKTPWQPTESADCPVPSILLFLLAKL